MLVAVPVSRAENMHVPSVVKSGSLTLLEPSGHVQACNGIAMLLLLYIQVNLFDFHVEMFILEHNVLLY